ncbi:hypothetical protein [Virgibacillus sediminis]|uniref:Uncharacterized protein n=1 Tax=Virgibacillus sediminis TaxID=202260 RepID=A0ABV7A7F6_9BACI
MNHFSGTVFSGEFDVPGEVFYLTQVKTLSTQSTLSGKQLLQLSSYLEKQSDSCTITVNDQLPVLLKKEEVEQLQDDLDSILKSLH